MLIVMMIIMIIDSWLLTTFALEDTLMHIKTTSGKYLPINPNEINKSSKMQ